MKAFNTELFIEKAKEIHGNKYDYSKVVYVNNKTKVCIICPIHGEFWQYPSSHLMGYGCRFCGYEVMKEKQRLSKEYFIEKSNKIHNNKYNYSQVEYKNNREKVKIICPEHGEFLQTPENHLNGHGCPYCAKKKLDKDFFIKKAKKIHGDKYDYSKVNYVKNNIKVTIICPVHGEFQQTPDKHLNRKGCPKCSESKIEEDCRLLLEKNNIKYIKEKKFNWLKDKSFLRLDFYIPEYNLAIECHGIQHFESVKHFGGKTSFENTLKRDNLKKELCLQNNVNIEYVVYNKNIKEQLKKIFKKYGNESFIID